MQLGSHTETETLSVSFGSKSIPIREWKGQLLKSPLSLDTETTLFDEDDPAPCPELILASAFDGEVAYVIAREDVGGFILHHAESQVIVHNAPFDFWVLETWLGKNDEHDARQALWRCAARRLHDVALLDRLLRLADRRQVHTVARRRSLATLARELLNVELPKDPSVRLGFGRTLTNGTTDYSRLTIDALKYAALDAIATWHVLKELWPRARAAQERHGEPQLANAVRRFGILSLKIQVQGAIALAAIMRRGLQVDTQRARALEDELRAERDRLGLLLEPSGVVTRTSTGWKKSTKVLKRHLRDAATRTTPVQGRQLELPLNGRGTDVSMRGRDWKGRVDDFVTVWLEYEDVTKLLGTFVKAVARVEVLRPRYNVLVRTGRTSSSRPNVQNLPRKGGVRECFRPRTGTVFLIADYKFVELVTLAQVHVAEYGHSRLAEAINAGRDPHKITAASITGKTEELISSSERSHSKAVNFGFPGGLGVRSFVAYARDSYGISLTEEQASTYRQGWIRAYPEMDQWLRSEDLIVLARNLGISPDYVLQIFKATPEDSGWVAALVLRVASGYTTKRNGESYKPATISRVWSLLRHGRLPPEHAESVERRVGSPMLAAYLKSDDSVTLTGRVRAGCGYTQVRNCRFQGLASDGAKIALFELTRSGYQVVAFIHDEVVLEIPERRDGDYESVVGDVQKIMVNAMREVCPDVKVEVDAYVACAWSKLEDEKAKKLWP